MAEKKVAVLKQKILTACGESELPAWLIGITLDSCKSSFLQAMYDNKCLNEVGELNAERSTESHNE